MPVTTINIRRLLCCCVLLLPTAPLQAFNGKAHRVVGHIAEALVCAETRIALAAIDDERDLAAAGVWADDIRAYRHTRHANRWHYINVPDNVSVADFMTDKRRRRDDNVLFAIEQFSWLLANDEADRLDRAMAYRYLVHFVADVHQPLHVGRREDQGGNRISVRVGERRTSLHSFWDGYDLQQIVDSPRDYARYLLEHNADSEVAIGGGPPDWAQESKDYRASVYDLGAARSAAIPELTPAYREKAMNIINLRLYQAGARLAGRLDDIFCRDAVKH